MSGQGGWTQSVNIDISKPREETIDKMFPEFDLYPDLYPLTKFQLNNQFGISSERVKNMSDKDTETIDKQCISNWLDEFFDHMSSKNGGEINDDFLNTLARYLCDDCPFGYDNSHRLASWIFGYFNNKKSEVEHDNSESTDRKTITIFIETDNGHRHVSSKHAYDDFIALFNTINRANTNGKCIGIQTIDGFIFSNHIVGVFPIKHD